MAILTLKRLARGVYFVWPHSDKVVLVVDSVPVASQDFATGTVELLNTATARDRYYTRKYLGRLGSLVKQVPCPIIFHRED